MMTFPGHNPHLFRWRGIGKSRKPADKMHVKNGDIDQWRKRVEEASEFAVSEVFSHKKPRSGTRCQAVPLHGSDQLRDHDEAYSEAQALLGDWLSSKLRLELEVEEEDDLMCGNERRSPAAPATAQPAALNYSKFDDLYNCLAEEEEQSAVNSVLQDLMEQEVLDSAVMEELALDVGQKRKKFRDPIVTMAARQLQVRENRVRRESERQRQRGEREALRDAREEAKRREQEEETRKRQQARRQEEMVQQEMVTLRRVMEEKRGLEQLVRQRERGRVEGMRTARSFQSAPNPPSNQQPQERERLYKEQKLQTMVLMVNLKCLQRHFSGWYSVVLDRRLRLGKAAALCDWKRQLRAWRAWRAAVWAEQQRRELVRTEEDLRAEHRQSKLAVESDRRRLLRRCLNEWQLRCRMDKEQRGLLAQQQETRRKMAALINAASTGKLVATEPPRIQAIMIPSPEPPERDHQRSSAFAPKACAVAQHGNPEGAEARPALPWQVTRRHAAPTAAELRRAQRRLEGGGFAGSKGAVSPGGESETRRGVQRQIIAQQRKLLKDQQEQIAQLRREQSVMGLELEMERTAQLAQLSALRGARAKSCDFDPGEQRASRVTDEPESLHPPPRKAVTRQTCSHPIVTGQWAMSFTQRAAKHSYDIHKHIAAMEVRAQQRAQRRKEIEELKRKKEEEKLAEMKAAEEQRQREEEEEKHKAAVKKREEKRQEREREEEKQRQQKRQQELLKLARHHYDRNLLLRRGLAPWKRLIRIRQANVQLNDWRMIREERAQCFYRTRTLRRFLLALLDHVTQERLVQWDRQELAQEHNNRRLLWRCLQAWRQLPCLLRKERVRDERREKLGRRVTEVLPDFCSNPP